MVWGAFPPLNRSAGSPATSMVYGVSPPTRQSHSQRRRGKANCQWVTGMPSGSGFVSRRRGTRTKAVLPVRIKGRDSAGVAFEDLVHTLDLTAAGARLGSIRRVLNVLDEVTVFYRKRKLQFRVVWTMQLKGTSEFQIGLQAVTSDKEAWGVNLPEQQNAAAPQIAASQASGGA
jgi:hypothetical protein